MRHTSWYPPSLLRFHLLTWRDMHRQHDAAEFLQFILPKLSWVPSRHEWSARLEVDGACRRESGNPQEHVLGLTPPDGLQSSNIQDTIEAWHRQVHTHALHSAPECIFLQLPRFREHNGVIVKRRIPLDLYPPTLHLPVFRHPDSLACDWTEYHIHAAIVHLGEGTTNGHYRTLLIQSQADGSSVLTDDNAEASSLRHNDNLMCLARENCYVLACGRRP